MDDAVLPERRALLLAEASPEKVLGEIGRCGDAHQRVDARPQRERGEQHDPGAHARSDEEQRSPRTRREDREGIVAPRADRPVDEPARRAPVPLIVEADEGAVAGAAPVLEVTRLRSCHVGRVSAQEDDGRAEAGVGDVGEAGAVRGVEVRDGRLGRRRGRRAHAGSGAAARRSVLTRPAARRRRRAAGLACTRCTGSAPAGSSRWRRGDPSPRGGRRSRRPWRPAPRCRSCRRRSARS